jgi:hypothetical protein
MANLRDRAGYDEELSHAARAIVLGLARREAETNTGSDPEVTLSALMLVAAGIISRDSKLKNARDIRLRVAAFGKMMREMALADRAAAGPGEATFLEILGGVALGGGDGRTAN